MAIALPFDSLAGGAGGLAGLASLTSLLGGLGGGGLPSLPGLDGLPGLGSLPSLPGLPSLGGSNAAAAEEGVDGEVNAGDGGASFDTGDLGGLLGGIGGGGLPELPGLGGGGLPSLPGVGGGGTGGRDNGSVFGTGDGIGGGLLNTLETSTFGIPILGENVSGIVGTQVEGGGIQNIVVTQAFGTPLYEPLQGLIGGNSVGEEIILYDLATRPVAFTEGIPVVNEVTREIVTGSYAQTTAFIGAYSGGILSEDYLQNFVSTDGTLGTLANVTESYFVNIPGGNFIFDGDDLNSALDQVTNATDQILYVDDLVAGGLGGDKLSNDLPFNNAFGGLLGSVNTDGIAAPAGDVFYTSITPLTTAIQEVAIAGPITLGSFGKLI